MQLIPIETKKTKHNLGVLAAVIVISLAVLAIPTLLGVGTPVALGGNGVDRSDACFMSQKLVKQNLKAPSTADFPIWSEENCKVTHSNNTWTVTSFVDAQNGFGAMIRTDYVAQMTYNPSTETWTLTNLFMD